MRWSTPTNVDKARKLRLQQTTPEGVLWALLRDSRLAGYKFRRQHPLGPYVADFFCHSLKLVLELDGHNHFNNSDQIAHDEKRTRWMQAKGYTVLRILNSDVIMNPEGVCQMIVEYIARQSPHPGPLPRGEGE
jgi:very-short-patch-repair endonuclease